eukprot:Skav210558  [mRNA]  locus=scaffold2317:39775:39984:+ [translate_table: standard]
MGAYGSTREHTGALVLHSLPQEAMLQGKEVPFSSDVENTAVELLQHLQINRTVGHLSRVPRLKRAHFGQ